MTAAEYRKAMGLDPVESKKPGARVVQKRDDSPAFGAAFNSSMMGATRRMIWLAGWAWMLFTSGFIGHLVVRWAESSMQKAKEDG